MLDNERILEFEQLVSSIQEEYEIPGLSVALAENGRTLYAEGFGMRNVGQELKATAETVYGIGSVTKSFTALAIMLLADAGKLAVGDPVRKHLPSFTTGCDETDRTVTLFHFLTHTSGLPPTGALRYAMVRSIQDDPSAEKLREDNVWQNWIDHPPIDSAEDLIQYLAEQHPRLIGPCGSQFSYSNDAYALLGAVVERVSGMPFPDFVEEKILRPLGMDASVWEPTDLERFSDVTELYMNDGQDNVIAAPYWNAAPSMLAAGFLKSNVLDLVKYGQVYHGLCNTGLSDQGLAAMTAPQVPCGRGNFYGFGLMVHPDYHGCTVVEHGGSLKGIAAAFGVVPESGLTAAVLANIVDVPVHRVWLAALNLALGLPLEEPLTREPQYHPGSKEELQRWVGTYRSDEGAELVVTLEDEAAYLENKGRKQCIRPSGPGTGAVMYRGSETGIRFVPGEDGQVRGIFHGYRFIPKV